MTSYKKTLPFSIPVAVFIAIGALTADTPWLLLLAVIPFLFAWMIVSGLNDPDSLKDDAEYARFGPLVNKLDAKKSFTEIKESLTPADVAQLQTLTSGGYHFPVGYIRKTIQANHKITYQGYITTKYIDEEGYHIGIGNATTLSVPAEIYRTLSLGDYICIAIAFVRLTISVSRPHFVLKYEVLQKAEALEN